MLCIDIYLILKLVFHLSPLSLLLFENQRQRNGGLHRRLPAEHPPTARFPWCQAGLYSPPAAGAGARAGRRLGHYLRWRRTRRHAWSKSFLLFSSTFFFFYRAYNVYLNLYADGKYVSSITMYGQTLLPTYNSVRKYRSLPCDDIILLAIALTECKDSIFPLLFGNNNKLLFNAVFNNDDDVLRVGFGSWRRLILLSLASVVTPIKRPLFFFFLQCLPYVVIPSIPFLLLDARRKKWNEGRESDDRSFVSPYHRVSILFLKTYRQITDVFYFFSQSFA